MEFKPLDKLIDDLERETEKLLRIRRLNREAENAARLEAMADADKGQS